MRLIDADALLESAGIFEAKVYARGAGKSIMHLAKAWLFNEVRKADTVEAEPVKHGLMRVEIITDDFRDMEIAKVRGWYRKKFFCPYCDQLIKTETWDKRYMFGGSSILKTNATCNYCPNCGAKMDLEE